MKNLEAFDRFAVKSKKKTHNKFGKAVIYTRVSSKEQAENNNSLNIQLKYCEKYAERKQIEVIEYFGGTYESAKSDERKEFTRMINFARKNKEVSYIIVYSYDRFSRTGANGAYISDQLKKQGIVTISATQEVDVNSASGSFQQNLYYMFSQFDNELRKDKSVTGMQEKLRKGYWIGTIPFGYTNLNPGKGKVQNIVINEKGKLLRQAFLWKARENVTNVEISKRLEKKGLVLHSKRLSDYFKNPFYCGLVVSGHIAGEVVEGKHKGLITKQMFLTINKIAEKRCTGYKYHRDREELPLKQFVKSSECGTPYTGYLVKKKGLFYYKNNRQGSKENISAKKMNGQFAEFLTNYEIADKKCIPVLKDMMKNIFVEQHQEQLEEVKQQKAKLDDLNKKIDRLEERYVVLEEVTKSQYDKFNRQLQEERTALKKDLDKNNEINLSNLDNLIEKGLSYALNLSKLWSSGTLAAKKALQNMLFPNGILFDFKNGIYRTLRINSFFSSINSLSVVFNQNKNGINSPKMNLSRSVPGAGVEPARPQWPQDFK